MTDAIKLDRGQRRAADALVPKIMDDPEWAAFAIVALRAKRDALRAALRAAQIERREEVEFRGGWAYQDHCKQCSTAWLYGEPEEHAPGCLAAPVERTGERT